MITKLTQSKLNEAVKSEDIGLEISKRFLEKVPKSEEEVMSLLASMDTTEKMEKKIFDALVSVMSHYDHGECGQEIAFEINNCTRALLSVSKGQEPGISPQPMDRIAFEALSLALASIDAAKEVQIAHDKMVSCLQSLRPMFKKEQSAESQVEVEVEVERPALAVSTQSKTRPENPPKPLIRKRIRLIKR